MKKYTKDRLLQLVFFVLFWELAFLIMAAFELTYLNTLDKLDYVKKLSNTSGVCIISF